MHALTESQQLQHNDFISSAMSYIYTAIHK